MKRQIGRGCIGLIAGLALLASSCGGGGGGGGSSSSSGTTSTPSAQAPTPTSTPIMVGSRNQRTESSADGSITLRVQNLTILAGGQTTLFSVLLTDANNQPIANRQISFCGMKYTAQACAPLQISLPNGDTTRGDGSITGSVQGTNPGNFVLTANTTDPTSLSTLSVGLTILVTSPGGPPTSTPTPTGPPPTTVAPTATPTNTPTQTPLPCTDVQTIIVQTDTLNVSSQSGGTPNITAVVLDSNNLPVANVNVLFDVQPRIGDFAPLVSATDSSGMAESQLRIPANSNFGTLTVSANACGTSGTVAINVVSGVSTKPVTSVVLQADPATVGDLTGGTVNLTAAVLDADNQPINGLDVLFITSVGKVNPLVNRTKTSGSQDGIATSVLQIPAGAVDQQYTISALAGGVSGSTIIHVVPGRVGPGGINTDVPSGEPAEITLGASPTRLQVAGTGGTELATVIGRVFDNNGNPLPGVRVHYHVVTAQSAPGAVVLPVTTPTPSGSPTPVPTTLCSPDDPVSISDTAGFAPIQIRSGTQPGPVTVAACADTIIHEIPAPLTAQAALVTVTSGAPDHISVTINSRAVDNNDGTMLTTVSAIVTDAQGNTVEDGTPVFFEILPQDATDPARNVVISSNSSTNAAPPCDVSQFTTQTGLPVSPQPGNAITCLKYPSIQQGTEIHIRASVAGIQNATNGQALSLPGFIGDLEVQLAPPTVTVDNQNDGLTIVHVSAYDANLAPLENVRVRFITSIGTIDSSALTDVNGEATATLTIPAGTPSGTGTLRIAGGGVLLPNVSVPIVNQGAAATPTPGQTAQPATIHFVSAEPTSIGVRGSGLPEQSTLTFQVTDALGTPLPGVPVSFSLAKIADESIAPSQSVSDANGNVQVVLTSGQRALSIQVTAQVNSVTPPLTTQSTAVNVLGGPPSQPNFSLAQQFHNIAGQVSFGLTDQITAFVGDRFGNPVPPSTAVNFTTKGGTIGNPTTTNSLGQATATLVSQAPVPAKGQVVTLATTRGERPFLDKNGNGICDSGDELQAVSEPYYDSNCNGVHDPGEDFIDLNGNGKFDDDQGSGTPSCGDQIVLFKNICTTFSGSTHVLLLSADSSPLPAGGTRDYTLIISDNPDPIGNPGVGNPIVGGSTVSLSVNGMRGRILGPTTFTLPDAQTNDQIIDGINKFEFSVTDNAPNSTAPETDAVVVQVTSDPGSLPAGGNGSVTVQNLVTFLAAPTPIPTSTVPSTSPTPTATSAPPTDSPTFSPPPSMTPTPAPTNTDTSTPAPTNTDTPTPPATATETFTSSPTATP